MKMRETETFTSKVRYGMCCALIGLAIRSGTARYELLSICSRCCRLLFCKLVYKIALTRGFVVFAIGRAGVCGSFLGQYLLGICSDRVEVKALET
jgi:hypothetical protein